jgi:hypothetical protein
MNVRVLFVIITTLTLTGCALSIPHQRPLSPIFHGEVKDAETGKPIESVDVWVWGRSTGSTGRSTASGRTDASGRYRVGVVEQVTWFVILFPLPAEGACSGFAVFTHPEYEEGSVAAGWVGTAMFDGPCGRVRRDVKLKRIGATGAEGADTMAGGGPR